MNKFSDDKQELKSFNDSIVCFNNYLKDKNLDKLIEQKMNTFIQFREFRILSKKFLLTLGYYSEYLVKLFIAIKTSNLDDVLEKFKHQFNEFGLIDCKLEDEDKDDVFDYDSAQVKNGDCVFICKPFLIGDMLFYRYSKDVEAIFSLEGDLICSAESVCILIYKLVVKRFHVL